MRLKASVVVAGALAAAAILNHELAKRAERRNPAGGRFIEVDGVRIHCLERGEGEPLVLLHGSGSMIQDFTSSNLVDLAAREYRVIIFDRPGHGHSTRPRGRIWTCGAQAELVYRALQKIGVSRAIVFGHSWGASVAVALALKHPRAVARLVLASGYYYPSARADLLALSIPAIPGIGGLLRHSVVPLLSRLVWPLMVGTMFAPAAVPQRFERRFPREIAVRPSQIRASAAESALLLACTFAYRKKYASLRTAVEIIVGEGDRLVDTAQSKRLHLDVQQSVIRRIPGAGHMVHQTAPEAALAAIKGEVDRHSEGHQRRAGC